MATTMAKAAKTSFVKCIRILKNFIAIISSRSICQMQANFPGVKSFGVHLGSRRERKYNRRLSGPMLT